MGSCRSGRLRRPPNKRGASLRGHGLTPGGKINRIIISRNNKATFSRNNIWGEVKVPWWGESSFFTPPLHLKQSGFFGCQWSVVLFGYGCAEEMKPEGRLKGKGTIVQSQQTVCLGSSDSGKMCIIGFSFLLFFYLTDSGPTWTNMYCCVNQRRKGVGLLSSY